VATSNAIESLALDDEIELAAPPSPSFTRIQHLLATAPILRRLDRNVLVDLACCSIERSHQPGRVLLPEELAPDPEPSVVLLTAGWCLGVRSLPDGSRTVVAVCGPGEVAGIERLTVRSSLPGLPAWVAAGDGAAVRLPVDALRDAIEWSDAARAELELAVADGTAWLEQLLLERLLPPAERLRRILVRLAGRLGRPPSRTLEVPLTQGELADLIGATRETVNRSLRRLASEGVVELREGRAMVHGPAPAG